MHLNPERALCPLFVRFVGFVGFLPYFGSYQMLFGQMLFGQMLFGL
jgi:hypothetical protein